VPGGGVGAGRGEGNSVFGGAVATEQSAPECVGVRLRGLVGEASVRPYARVIEAGDGVGGRGLPVGRAVSASGTSAERTT